MDAGLIGAACGLLDTLLKNGLQGLRHSAIVSNGSPGSKTHINGSTPVPTRKPHINGSATKLTNTGLVGFYCNGNGLHV